MNLISSSLQPSRISSSHSTEFSLLNLTSQQFHNQKLFTYTSKRSTESVNWYHATLTHPIYVKVDIHFFLSAKKAICN